MTPSPPIRVVLVDDHAVVRAGLQYFLATTSDIVVVGEAGDGAQALVVVNELQPDVVVLDLMMPKVDGITALTELHEGHPHMRVLMLTSFVEGPLIQQALQLGACGYLLKDAAGEEFAAAIRTAYAGRSVLRCGGEAGIDPRGQRAAHAGRGSDGARARGVGPAGQRAQQQAHRGGARHQPQHGAAPCAEYSAQAGRRQSDRRRGQGGAVWARPIGRCRPVTMASNAAFRQRCRRPRTLFRQSGRCDRAAPSARTPRAPERSATCTAKLCLRTRDQRREHHGSDACRPAAARSPSPPDRIHWGPVMHTSLHPLRPAPPGRPRGRPHRGEHRAAGRALRAGAGRPSPAPARRPPGRGGRDRRRGDRPAGPRDRGGDLPGAARDRGPRDRDRGLPRPLRAALPRARRGRPRQLHPPPHPGERALLHRHRPGHGRLRRHHRPERRSPSCWSPSRCCSTSA